MALDRVYAQTGVTFPRLPFVGPHANAGQTPKSGDPCVYGKIPAVAASDADADGNTVAFKDGIFNLPVKGEGGAMVVGAIVYFDATDDACPLNDDNAGVQFGYILDAVGNLATTVVRVQVGK